MKGINELWNEMLEAEKRSDMLDEAWAEDLENEALEAEWDEAYADYWNAFNAVAAEIERMSSKAIDKATAAKLISERRERMGELIAALV